MKNNRLSVFLALLLAPFPGWAQVVEEDIPRCLKRGFLPLHSATATRQFCACFLPVGIPGPSSGWSSRQNRRLTLFSTTYILVFDYPKLEFRRPCMNQPAVALAFAATLIAVACALFWPGKGWAALLLRALRTGERESIEDALEHLHDCEYLGSAATTASLGGALELGN